MLVRPIRSIELLIFRFISNVTHFLLEEEPFLLDHYVEGVLIALLQRMEGYSLRVFRFVLIYRILI